MQLVIGVRQNAIIGLEKCTVQKAIKKSMIIMVEKFEKCKRWLQKRQKEINRNGILLPKLFWPTVRKNCSSVREKLLKFEAEGLEF